MLYDRFATIVRNLGFDMLGNGFANIVAALIIAFAIIWSGKDNAHNDQYEELLARIVSEKRDDLIVNCDCCREDEGQRRASDSSF